jgi:hypothetical protein
MCEPRSPLPRVPSMRRNYPGAQPLTLPVARTDSQVKSYKSAGLDCALLSMRGRRVVYTCRRFRAGALHTLFGGCVWLEVFCRHLCWFMRAWLALTLELDPHCRVRGRYDRSPNNEISLMRVSHDCPAAREARMSMSKAVVVQRALSDLKLNPHLHVVFLDGAC